MRLQTEDALGFLHLLAGALRLSRAATFAVLHSVTLDLTHRHGCRRKGGAGAAYAQRDKRLTHLASRAGLDGLPFLHV